MRRLLRLKEFLTYWVVHTPHSDLRSGGAVTIGPGLVDEAYLRGEAGDELVDRCLRLGVLEVAFDA